MSIINGFALLNQFSKEFEDRKKALADFLGINIDYWNNDKYMNDINLSISITAFIEVFSKFGYNICT